MDEIEKSLKRVQGQVGGIQRMYVEGKSCLKIVQQVAATREALGRVGREVLKKEACKCMVDEVKEKKFGKILKQLFKF